MLVFFTLLNQRIDDDETKIFTSKKNLISDKLPAIINLGATTQTPDIFHRPLKKQSPAVHTMG